MRKAVDCLSAVLAAVLVPLVHGQTVDTPLKIGNGVAAPKLTRQVDPEFPRSVPHKWKGGECVIYLVVDTNGLPKRVTVQSTNDKRLNEPALKAVNEYRFEPATREGKPVAVEMTVNVAFQVFP